MSRDVDSVAKVHHCVSNGTETGSKAANADHDRDDGHDDISETTLGGKLQHRLNSVLVLVAVLEEPMLTRLGWNTNLSGWEVTEAC